jgi:hypothetical protein
MQRVVLAVAMLTVWITAAAADVDCYEGKAFVKQDAPKGACTATEKGYANTGKGPKTHDGCTAAKHQAADKLRYRLSTSCKPYVGESGCTVIRVKSCS